MEPQSGPSNPSNELNFWRRRTDASPDCLSESSSRHLPGYVGTGTVPEHLQSGKKTARLGAFAGFPDQRLRFLPGYALERVAGAARKRATHVRSRRMARIALLHRPRASRLVLE